jgi:hypothetical protein
MAATTPPPHEAQRRALRVTLEELRQAAASAPVQRAAHLHRAAERLEEAVALLARGPCTCGLDANAD